MIYVVLIPAWLWVILLVVIWATLFYQAYVRLGFRHLLMISLLAVLAVQALAASSTAIVTSQDPLSKFACLMGYIGMWVAFSITLAEGIVLPFLSKAWPQNSEGKKLRFGNWLSIWFIFNVIALLAHIRSAGLCTV